MADMNGLLNSGGDGSPTSNIDALLNSGLLTPTGAAAPPPQTIPLQSAGMGAGPDTASAQDLRSPNMPAPMVPRMTDTKRGMVDRIHDWLMDKTANGSNVPSPAGGGVSPDANPSYGPFDALKAGFTDKVVSSQMHTAQLQSALAGMQEESRLRDVRKGLAAQFPPTPGETDAQLHSRMQEMYAYLVQNGDLEGAKELGQTARAILAMPKATALNPETEVIKGVAGDPNGPNAGKTVTRIIDKRKVPTDPGYVLSEFPEAAAPRSGDAVDANRRFEAEQRGSIMSSFSNETKPFQTSLQSYNVVKSATSNPTNPTAPSTALMGLAHLMSPTARGSGQMMQVLKDNIGSFSDKVKRYINRGMTGQAEPGLLPEIQSQADAIMQQQVGDYNVTRNNHLKRGNAVGIDMSSMLSPAPTFGASPAGMSNTGRTAADLRATLSKP